MLMKKVLALIPDNNKGKFIVKGFTEAFRKLSFFVYEIKIYDLNIDKINNISPDIIFMFHQNTSETFLNDYSLNADFIHCAEYIENIPQYNENSGRHYIFASNSKNRKNKYIQPVSADDYKTSFEGYKYNISFAGSPACGNREIILSELVKNFGVINIFCPSYCFYKSLDEIRQKKLLDEKYIKLYQMSYRGYVSSQKELACIYAAAKVNIDIQSPKPKDINYRLLEITASGGFIEAPYSKTLIKQYDDGRDIETYKNVPELIDKTAFYLKNTGLAQIIAENGRNNTVSNFSYYDRLKTMLKAAYGRDFNR